MNIKVLAPIEDRSEHREAIWDLLKSKPRLTRILALNVHDVELVGDLTLQKAIRRLLDANLTVTIVVGERLEGGKNEEQRRRIEKVVGFLKDISDRGGNVHVQSKLHAKVVFVEEADAADALVTSANLTTTALFRNYEAGVYFKDLDSASLRKLKSFTNWIIGQSSTRSIEDVV